MKTLELKGNLLNLFVALAMGGVEGQDLLVPFDAWECGIGFRGNDFHPERDVAAVWPELLMLRIGSVDAGDDRWLVSMPDSAHDQDEPFPPCICANPLDGIRLAVVWSVYGPEVTDTFDSELFGTVELAAYNH